MCAKTWCNTKTLHIVTWQGTKIGPDNPQISNIKQTNVYPNPRHEKQTYKEETHVFQDIAWQEDIDNSQLIQTDKSISQFIDLLHEIKSTNPEKHTKNICNLNQKDKSDADPLVDLEIEGYHVRQVVLDFGSQVNMMTRNTWEQMGRPRLYELGIYLKLPD